MNAMRSRARPPPPRRADGIGVAGMVDSKEFAVGIFDALARRRRQNLERISKDELYEFWLQISDQSFDARLQIFFDMCATAPHNPAPISSVLLVFLA